MSTDRQSGRSQDVAEVGNLAIPTPAQVAAISGRVAAAKPSDVRRHRGVPLLNSIAVHTAGPGRALGVDAAGFRAVFADAGYDVAWIEDCWTQLQVGRSSGQSGRRPLNHSIKQLHMAQMA